MSQSDQPLRILIIEDDDFYQETIKNQLQILGYNNIETAANLKEAQEKLKQAANEDSAFAIATVDMRFTDPEDSSRVSVDGLTIVRYIKSNFHDTACILITNETLTPSEVLDFRDVYEVDYFIPKLHLNDRIMSNAIERALRRRQRKHETITGTVSPVPSEPTGPRIFISYHRKATWSHARLLANSLREMGLTNLFLDTDSITQGHFDTVIRENLRTCQFFLPILTYETFESPWVREEVRRALVHEPAIIPILVDGFTFDDTDLPEGTTELKRYNAIELTPDNYEFQIKRLVSSFIQT